MVLGLQMVLGLDKFLGNFWKTSDKKLTKCCQHFFTSNKKYEINTVLIESVFNGKVVTMQKQFCTLLWNWTIEDLQTIENSIWWKAFDQTFTKGFCNVYIM